MAGVVVVNTVNADLVDAYGGFIATRDGYLFNQPIQSGLMIAGTDGTNNHILRTNSSGQLVIAQAGIVNTKDASDGPVTPGTVATNSILVGGQFNTTLPTLTNTQQSAIQIDSNGRLLIGSIANALPTGSNTIGFVELMDGYGNKISSTTQGTSNLLNVYTPDAYATGVISTASSFGIILFGQINSTISTTNSFVSIFTEGHSTLGLTITGSWSGTLVFEATNDGINWFTTEGTSEGTGNYDFGATNAGHWKMPIAGYQQFRVRALSGTTFTINATVSYNLGIASSFTTIADSLPSGTNAIGSTIAGISLTTNNSSITPLSAATLITTGNITSGSNQLTNLASTAGLVNGQIITITSGNSSYLPSLTTITNITGTTVTMSANANTTATAVSVIFSATGQYFTGISDNISPNYSEIDITVGGSASSVAPGILFFEFSANNSNWDVSVPVNVNDVNTGIVPLTLRNILPYFRVRYINKSVAQTSFRLGTQYHQVTAMRLTRLLGQLPGLNEPVEGTSASVNAYNPLTSTYPDLTTTYNGGRQALDVALNNINNNLVDNILSSDRSMFGSAVVHTRIGQVFAQFDQSNVTNNVSTTSSGGATFTQSGGLGLLTSGTATTAAVAVFTNQTVKYSPGREIYTEFTAAFTTPTSINSSQRAGIYDANNGFFLGYNGTNFGITVRTGAVDTFTAFTSLNGDKLDGSGSSVFTSGGTPQAIIFTNINIYRIKFGWLGSAPIDFQVYSPDKQWVTFHTIRQPNSSINPSIQNPNLTVRMEVIKNTADATSLTIRTGSWDGGIVAENPGSPPSVISSVNSSTTIMSSATLITTGNITVGSNSLTSLASTSGLVVGQIITIINNGVSVLPSLTTITKITGSTVTMSNNSLVTLTGISVTFSGTGSYFTGIFENILAYPELDINIAGASNTTAPGTLFFEYSPDGYNVDASIAVSISDINLGSAPIPLRNNLPYFRTRYINGSVAQTAFRMTILLHTQTATDLTKFLNQSISSSEPVKVTAAVLKAEDSSSNFQNITTTLLGTHQVVDVGAYMLPANTTTLTSVTASTSSTTILSANASRKMATVYNNGTGNLYLAHSSTASTSSFTVRIVPNAYYELPVPVYQGIISGITNLTGGTWLITEET